MNAKISPSRIHEIQAAVQLLVFSAAITAALPTWAGTTHDAHGNIGYDTAQECDAAVASGKAKFYQPFTSHPPLKRKGEASVREMTVTDLVNAKDGAARLGFKASQYAKGACDVGVGRSFERDGVTTALLGKYIPYAPNMPVNVYFDAKRVPVRATVKMCDNNFAKAFPRPVGLVDEPAPVAPVPVAAIPSSDCFVSVAIPTKYETRSEQVIKVPASTKFEMVPAVYKTVNENVMVSPAYTRQIPVPATYKVIFEEIEAGAPGFREEPVPATYKIVKDQVLVKPESKRLVVTPETYQTVMEKVVITPERKEIKSIPAVYAEKEEMVEEKPASTRVETVPPTFKTVSERYVIRPESVRYEPISLPMRVVTRKELSADASARVEVTEASYRTVTEQVVVKEATRRLVEVPALFDTVTERVKVSDASTEWKRGRAWVAKAITVRPAKSFVVGSDGKVDGSRVDPKALSGADDDMMCLVEIPEQFQTMTRQVLRSPASVREEITPPVYATVTKQVVDREAKVNKVDLPATYQSVSYQEIDAEKLRSMGYRFDGNGDIVATPAGERVLRASAVNAVIGTVSAVLGGAKSGQQAYVREVKIPAEYGTTTRQVVDQPAVVRSVEVPAVMQKVKRRVVVSPARTEEVVIPAVVKEMVRQVVDQAASTREVVEPAEYKIVERRVVDTPATTRRIPLPVTMKKVERRVVDVPASVREEVVPAVYKIETRQVVEVPATTREVQVPAQYEALTRQVKVADATVERREILCETNATPRKIAELQNALRRAGFNPGRVDGVISKEMMNSINQFQVAKSLPVDKDGRYVNLDTVKALGVNPD